MNKLFGLLVLLILGVTTPILAKSTHGVHSHEDSDGETHAHDHTFSDVDDVEDATNDLIEVEDFSDADDADDMDDVDDFDDFDDFDDIDAEYSFLEGEDALHVNSLLVNFVDDMEGVALLPNRNWTQPMTQGRRIEKVNSCIEDFDMCIRNNIGVHQPIDTIFGPMDDEAFFVMRQIFQELAEFVSALAFFLFLCIEFFKEYHDIKQSMMGRDEWERLTNRLFEVWCSVTLPRFIRSGILKQDEKDKSFEAVAVTKKGDPITYMYVRRYKIHPSIRTATLARKMIGTPVPLPYRVPRHVPKSELLAKQSIPLCELCQVNSKPKPDRSIYLVKQKANQLTKNACADCQYGLTKVLDTVAAPLQSWRSNLSIFNIFFTWNLFVDTSRLKRATGASGLRTYIRRDVESLLNNFWGAVAARSSALWRMLRQGVVSVLFFGYFFTNLRLDFFILLIITVVKFFVFWVAHHVFFNKKIYFGQLENFQMIVHVAECVLISWIYWTSDGAYRSAAVGWRIIQELEVHPMAFAVRPIEWWVTSRVKLLQMITVWLKGLLTLGKAVGTCQTNEEFIQKYGEEENLEDDHEDLGDLYAEQEKLAEEAAKELEGSDEEGEGIHKKHKRKEAEHRKKPIQREATQRTADKIAEEKGEGISAKFDIIQTALEKNFSYLNLREEGVRDLYQKAETWLTFCMQASHKANTSRYLYIAAQDKFQFKNYRVRRIIPACGLIDSNGGTKFELNLDRIDEKARHWFGDSNVGDKLRRKYKDMTIAVSDDESDMSDGEYENLKKKAEEEGDSAQAPLLEKSTKSLKWMEADENKDNVEDRYQGLLEQVLSVKKDSHFKYGGVFSQDSIFLANTSYWWNSYNFHSYPEQNRFDMLAQSLNSVLPHMDETKRLEKRHTEIDRGVAPSEDVIEEWQRWEDTAAFEEARDPIIKATNDQWEQDERARIEREVEEDRKKESELRDKVSQAVADKEQFYDDTEENKNLVPEVHRLGKEAKDLREKMKKKAQQAKQSPPSFTKPMTYAKMLSQKKQSRGSKKK